MVRRGQNCTPCRERTKRGGENDLLVKADAVRQQFDERSIESLALGIAELDVDGEGLVDSGRSAIDSGANGRTCLQDLDKGFCDDGLVCGNGKVELDAVWGVDRNIDVSLDANGGAADAVARGGVLEA